MICTHHKNHAAIFSGRLAKRLWVCLFLCLASACVALATIPLGPGSGSDPNGPNYASLNYSVPGNPPPTVDATAFDNENTYTVSFTALTVNPEFYETWNTVNYTNNGTMTVNSPIVTNINSGVFGSAGCGFKFDTQTTNVIPRQMAGTFYNPGTIRCDSIIDGNNVFVFGGLEEFFVDTVGEFIVSATNVVNSGTVDVGVNGLMQFGGQNVNLTGSTLTVENLQSLFLGDSVGVNGSGAFGLDTNADWDPTFDLGPTYAEASLPDLLFLTNSTSYFNIVNNGPSNVIVRAVFVQNNNPNVPYNVYIDPNVNAGALGFAAGAAHVEWVGTYINPATGAATTNYLYLTDDYVFGATTNVALINGVPDNFTFITSTTPLLANPTAAGFQNVFTPGILTNRYSYFNAQLVSTTAPTNATPANPSGALTNLNGRIQITASGELNLAQAQISGMNYLALTSTNQFDGNVGAQIASPYSDISLGVTNGFLAVTNLLESALPDWTGNVQAWSTRWVMVDTNGVTNDFRVMIVGSSQLQPVSQPQVQNLKLHATNSLVISDVLNAFASLNIDAQNLTLTTNIIGNGAQSLDGELNVENPALFWSVCVPNLRNLTNNGAIRLQNLANFGSASAHYSNFINAGVVADQGAQIWADNFNSSGAISNYSTGGASFALQATNAVLTNGLLVANGNVSINTGSLLTSNLVLQAGRSLTLAATNLLTDTDATNGGIWSVGAVAINNGTGMSLPIKPPVGDLLGTTITNIAPTNVNFTVTWAGNDRGVSNAGFTNNVAVGRLILNGQQATPGSKFIFNGAGVSNAIYVDYLEFDNYATNNTSYNFPELSINTNMVVYFAQAYLNGVSVAEKIDVASRDNGRNNGRLRWVPTYAGYFSSTNIVSGGVTNTVNAALAQSPDIDSDGDGIANGSDTTPFFLASEMNFAETLTNVPPLSVLLSWQTIPNATNYVYYKTNLVSTNWLLLTNFISPQPYPSSATNVSVLDPINPVQPKYYRVTVQPNLTQGE
jgi:hypothetical protein